MWLLQTEYGRRMLLFCICCGRHEMIVSPFPHGSEFKKILNEQLFNCVCVCIRSIEIGSLIFVLRSINKQFEIYVVSGLTQQVCHSAHKIFRSEIFTALHGSGVKINIQNIRWILKIESKKWKNHFYSHVLMWIGSAGVVSINCDDIMCW